MGRSILYYGDCGKGQLIKAFKNVVYDINLASISEIMPLVIKLGLVPDLLEQLFTSGSSYSFTSEHFVPRMIERTFTGDYSLRGAFKDITNVQQATSKFNDDTPMFDAMVNTYQKAINIGFGEVSKSAMLKIYEKNFGVTVVKSVDKK
jgi:3-hydroxyisobutyrate dehydrogenase-like beta-hydroxyacid dehydrogenase